MVFFVRCRGVSVTGVALLNAPYWTLFLLGCDEVHVRGLTIRNPPLTPNGDGIDIDCCRNVTVSGLHRLLGAMTRLRCAAMRARSAEDKPCENVTITNCVLSTPCNAIRVGVGDGRSATCTVSNMVVTGSRTGINMVCRYSDFSPRGVQIEGIRFANFLMDTVLPIQVIPQGHRGARRH